MRADLRASLEGLMEEYTRQAAQVRAAQRELSEISATAATKDGMVTVTVGPRGRVTDIRFNPRVYRRLTPSELAGTLLELIGQASGEVSERTRKIMASVLPDELPLDELLGTGGDLTAFLPQPEQAPDTGSGRDESR